MATRQGNGASSEQSPAVLCLGAGFTTSYLARHFDADVRFLSRRLPQDLSPFEKGFQPQIIVDSVPPVRVDGRLQNPLYCEQWQEYTDAVWIHLSSTSVYDREQAIVTERTPAHPDDHRGQERLDLEAAVLQRMPEAVIFRCGGIYGPGRSLPLSLLRGQAAHLPADNRYVSRIHVHDLCRLILSVGKRLWASTSLTGLPTSQSPRLPSLLPGHERRNLLLAVDPSPSPTAETLAFIREQWPSIGAHLPVTRHGPPIGRRITSLYAADFGPFTFADYRAGFLHCMQGESDRSLQ